MTKRRRRTSWWRVTLLVVLIGIFLYINQVVVPATPPLFIPTPTATRSPESFVAEADQLYQEGRLNQAVEAYKKAVLVDPENPSNYINLARLQIWTGDYEDAITNTKNALLQNPNNPLAHAVQAWALNFTGDYTVAEAEVRKALDLDPNNALAHAVYAEILIDKGNFDDVDKAIEESRLAWELGRGQLEVHRARGLVLASTQNLEQAAEEFQTAIAINDKIADLHLQLGFVYRAMGENDMAVDELLFANSLADSADTRALVEIMLAYANDGQYEKAAQYAQEAVNKDPTNPKMHGYLGMMYYRLEDYAKAIPELSLAIHGGTTEEGDVVEGLPLDYGTVAEYYTRYAFSLARTNRCAEAVPIFRTMLTGLPNDEIAVYNAEFGLDLCMEGGPTVEEDAETETGEAGVEAGVGDVEQGTEATPAAE